MYTAKEVADKLKVSKRTVLNYCTRYPSMIETNDKGEYLIPGDTLLKWERREFPEKETGDTLTYEFTPDQWEKINNLADDNQELQRRLKVAEDRAKKYEAEIQYFKTTLSQAIKGLNDSVLSMREQNLLEAQRQQKG